MADKRQRGRPTPIAQELCSIVIAYQSTKAKSFGRIPVVHNQDLSTPDPGAYETVSRHVPQNIAIQWSYE
jgi:hypothetical protein